ncbi:MAG: HU family DNA-binding protein [Balneolaceae bacterium]
MTQTSLIERLAHRLKMTQSETHHLLKAVTSEWTDQLAREEAFTIPGLGTFRTEIQDTRTRYSPHHDQMLLLPPKVHVRFSPSQSLKDALLEQEGTK